MTQPVTLSSARIEQGLTGLGRAEVLRLLRPGLSSRYTRKILSSCGLRSIEDLEAVYGVWNGTEARLAAQLDDMWLFPGFYLLTLEDAAVNYRALIADFGWTTGWWPVFADGGGDFLVVDLHGESLGAVRHFRLGEDKHPVEYQSLSLMLATLAAGFGRGLSMLMTGETLKWTMTRTHSWPGCATLKIYGGLATRTAEAAVGLMARSSEHAPT